MHEIKTILYAEDDFDDRLFFKEALKQPINGGSYEVKFADNGAAALHYLETHSLPDILFLDLNMPVKTGLECLREIKQNFQITDLPVVILTTSRSEPEICAARELGATIYAIKPMSIQQLSFVLDTCLSRVNCGGNITGPQSFVIG